MGGVACVRCFQTECSLRAYNQPAASGLPSSPVLKERSAWTRDKRASILSRQRGGGAVPTTSLYARNIPVMPRGLPARRAVGPAATFCSPGPLLIFL